LETLPPSIANCRQLELLRLASNRFSALPDWLLQMPSLAWLAIAGNPLTSALPPNEIPEFDWNEIEIGTKIGEGASGFIHQAKLNGPDQGQSVAVKIFKGAMTSDGLPANEMAACLAAGQHPNLVGATGKITNHPDGLEGLVMPLIGKDFTTLAGPPSLDSCTRDIYPEGFTLDLPTAIRIALGIASAAEHLHSQQMLHGDLYGHNVLWNANGESMLGDFGAATFYPEPSEAFQRIEVRAFGILLEELLTHCKPSEARRAVWDLANICASPTASQRPTFTSIVAELHACS
jgi:serine/threonine protein kinase